MSLNDGSGRAYVLARYSAGAYAVAVSTLPTATVGGNIRRRREAAGFNTQGALARAMSVPQPQVSDWENDRYKLLDTETLMRIGKTIRASVDELLEGVDPDYDAVLYEIKGSTRTADSKPSPHEQDSYVPLAERTAEVLSAIDTLSHALAEARTRLTESDAMPTTTSAGRGRGGRRADKKPA